MPNIFYRANKLLTRALVEIRAVWDPREREFARAYACLNPIEGWLESPVQERWLFNRVRSLPETAAIVEIGSFKGRSTASLASACRGTQRRVIAIDLFDGSQRPSRQEYFDEFKANIKRCGLEAFVTPIRGDSAVIGQTWRNPIDFIFIDGAHDYAGVRADFENFFPHVVPGGTLAFHDVHPNWPDVVRVWQEVAQPSLAHTGRCGSIAFGIKPQPADEQA